MFSWLMAKFYDCMLRDAEKKCLRDWRKVLLQNLSGDVIDLGCGTGANLEFYPQSLNSLVLAEPSPYMRHQLVKKLTTHKTLPTKILDCTAESIPYPDSFFDAVVSTLLLCTANNSKQALSEIHRVLRPGGKLLFIEHVAAGSGTKRLKWQRIMEPLWKILQCGCHLTRDTERDILQAGFILNKITRQSIRGVPSIVRPSIWGEAIKV